MIIIFDNSSLILLIERLCLSDKIAHFKVRNIRLVVPSKVFIEFSKKGKTSDIEFIKANFMIESTGVLESLDTILDNDSGEMGVAFLADKFEKEKKEYLCVVDEYYCRRVFRNFTTYRFSGSIGLLKTMKKDGILTPSDIEKIVKIIRESEFRIDSKLVSSLQIDD